MTRDRLAYGLMGAVAVSAAVLSFSSLQGLAELSGVTGSVAGFRLAWLLPIAIDAFAIAATRCWLDATMGETVRLVARRYSLGAIGLSVAGNATYHVITSPAPSWQDVTRLLVVSAVPPVVLGLVVHLQALVSTDRLTPAQAAETAVEPVTVSVPSETPAETVSPVERPRKPRVSRSAADVMRAHWATETAQGRTPTGADLDRVAGTKSLGRRVRRELLTVTS